MTPMEECGRALSGTALRHFEPSRIRISMRSLLVHRLVDLFDLVRLKRAGVPEKQAAKAWRRARAVRFYRRAIHPEMAALIEDMKRPKWVLSK